MTNSALEIVQVDAAAHRDDILRVLERNLPEASDKSRFEWLYLENPEGEALVWIAYNEDRDPVATSAAIPRKIKIGDSEIRGLLLSDFAIDEKYRTLGPALQLLKATLLPVENGDYRLSFDYPSRSMYAIYSRLGATALGAESRYVRMVTASQLVHRYTAPGKLSSVLGRTVDSALNVRDSIGMSSSSILVETHSGDFDNEFSKFSEIIGKVRKCFIDRNEQYLNWRFRRHPSKNYVVAVARDRGSMVGYTILHKEDNETVCIDELVCLPDGNSGRGLLQHVAKSARKMNVEKVQCTVLENSPLGELLSKSSFSFRDSGIGPVVVAGPDIGATSEMGDGNLWWLGEGDRDG